ncbi:MAG TPA: T9SS type A sorting domain-containing protein [bacterium]|jgi:hypothetical protein
MKWFCLFSLMALSTMCVAQPDTLWSRTYGGSGDEYAAGIVALSNGTFAVSATTNSFGVVGMDFYVVCVNGGGDTLWTRTFGRGTGDDWCTGMAKTNNDEIIASGYGLRSGGTEQAMREVRYDLSGTLIEWVEDYSPGADMIGYGICMNALGHSVCAGYWTDTPEQGRVTVLERDSQHTGFSLYAQCGYFSDARSIQPTRDGGYILAGSTRATANAHSDYLLMRLNSLGDTVWTRTFGGSATEDIANSVVQTSDGGFAFTGPSESYGPGGDVVLIKTDTLGRQQWLHTYGGSDEEHGHVVLATHDGGFFLAGHTNSFGVGGDVYVVKTDGDGNLLWSRSWGGAGLDVAESAVELPDGGFLVAGETTSFGAGDANIWLLRIASDLASDQPSVASPGEFFLAQNYPNPFNAVTDIRFELPHAGRATLSVYDVLGRETATLLDGQLPGGPHTVHLDASGWPSGVYFCRLSAGQSTGVRKLMLLK